MSRKKMFSEAKFPEMLLIHIFGIKFQIKFHFIIHCVLWFYHILCAEELKENAISGESSRKKVGLGANAHISNSPGQCFALNFHDKLKF